MASLNDYSNNAKIICPYFKMQYRTSIRCCGFLEGQKSTNLVFATSELKTKHIYNFCASRCYFGCPIALSCSEEEENEENSM